MLMNHEKSQSETFLRIFGVKLHFLYHSTISITTLQSLPLMSSAGKRGEKSSREEIGKEVDMSYSASHASDSSFAAP